MLERVKANNKDKCPISIIIKLSIIFQAQHKDRPVLKYQLPLLVNNFHHVWQVFLLRQKLHLYIYLMQLHPGFQRINQAIFPQMRLELSSGYQ